MKLYNMTSKVTAEAKPRVKNEQGSKKPLFGQAMSRPNIFCNNENFVQL